MITLLSRIFIKDRSNYTSQKVREAYGVLCGGLGIFLNILLFVGKFFAGAFSGSIAITVDAFNNLSDAGSSIISLLGFKLAGKKPDPDHPFGHGRIEYISGLIISMLILLMGVELVKSSFEKIINPEEVSFELVAVAVMIISILTKVYMSVYNKRIGKKIDSSSMKATALDSLSDTIATTAVLISMFIIKFTGINIDGYVGIGVSAFVLYAGCNAAKDTIQPLLGQVPEADFVKSIEDIVLSHNVVVGIHDLIVHDYGPGRVMISLHAEVPMDKDLLSVHDEIDNIEKELKEKLNCEAIIHMDPIAIDDELTNSTKKQIETLVKELDEKITIHDFRMVTGPTHTNVIFDIVVPYDFKMSDSEVKKEVNRLVESMNGKYFAVVNVDKLYI